jgi:hypothetical protein
VQRQLPEPICVLDTILPSIADRRQALGAIGAQELPTAKDAFLHTYEALSDVCSMRNVEQLFWELWQHRAKEVGGRNTKLAFKL